MFIGFLSFPFIYYLFCDLTDTDCYFVECIEYFMPILGAFILLLLTFAFCVFT